MMIRNSDIRFVQRLFLGGVVGSAFVLMITGIFGSWRPVALDTWVRCVVEVNGRRVTAPVYIESIVTTYPFAVEIDYETNRVRPVGGAEPSVMISAPPAR